MDITVTEIMYLADMHAHAKITEGTPAEMMPRNLLQHRMQQICTDVFVLQCQLIEARREIASLQAQLEAVGAGGVGPMVGNAAPQPAAQAQPVATIYVTEDGSREVDDWKVELPVGATTLYTAAQAQQGDTV